MDVVNSMIDSIVSCVKCGAVGVDTCNCWIRLECPKCKTSRQVERLSHDHPKAVKVLITCPDCNEGDFDETVYLDAEGNHLIDDYYNEE